MDTTPKQKVEWNSGVLKIAKEDLEAFRYQAEIVTQEINELKETKGSQDQDVINPQLIIYEKEKELSNIKKKMNEKEEKIRVLEKKIQDWKDQIHGFSVGTKISTGSVVHGVQNSYIGIQQLNGTVTKTKTMEWTHVKDKKPHTEVPVIVQLKNGHITGAERDVNGVWQPLGAKTDPDISDVVLESCIEYWAPLPEAPIKFGKH